MIMSLTVEHASIAPSLFNPRATLLRANVVECTATDSAQQEVILRTRFCARGRTPPRYPLWLWYVTSSYMCFSFSFLYRRETDLRTNSCNTPQARAEQWKAPVAWAKVASLLLSQAIKGGVEGNKDLQQMLEFVRGLAGLPLDKRTKVLTGWLVPMTHYMNRVSFYLI